MTNYERIKSMSIDEMAEFFCANFDFDIDSAREMLNKNFNAIYNDEIRIYNEIIQDLESEISLAEYVDRDYCNNIDLSLMKSTLDLIKRLQAENDDLSYKLTGVTHSVDKWLEGDELKQDEVNRAATMREKTLRLIESAKDEAMTEFADRLQLRCIKQDGCLCSSDISAELKEMIGEE